MRTRTHLEPEIDVEAGRAELDAVLNSRLFSRARSLSKILSFICTRYIDQDVDSINEWSIAVEGLGRTDFDPEKDSIVRVEFHHLRKRLAQYYLAEGADHPVQIVLPDSGYVPRFKIAGSAPGQPRLTVAPVPKVPEEEPGATAAVAVRHPRYSLWAALGTALFAAAALTAWHRIPSAKPALAPAPPVIAGSLASPVRLLAGFSGPAYIDSSGHSWDGDRYFEGGVSFNHPDVKIFRTADPAIFERGREGEFRYDIPVQPGRYELRLHFAETRYGQSPLEGAEAIRRFNVFFNGRQILTDFDITRDAGGSDTATNRIWEQVAPAEDGRVHLRFTSHSGAPMLNALELLPNSSADMLPVRIVVGRRAVYDHQGRFWAADDFFLGGRSVDRLNPVQNTADPGLYTGVRFGNFSYAIPVVQGRTYQLTLGFADGAYSRPGDRLFDILCNGRTLAQDFDIIAAAGGNSRALTAVFKGLKPNAQSKLDLSFIPSRDYASISFLEVTQEPRR